MTHAPIDEPGGAAVAASIHRFLDRSPLAVGLVDEGTRLIAGNELLYELLGHPSGSLDGAVTIDLVHPDDLQLASDQLATMVSGGLASINTEVRVRRADGAYVPLRLSITDLRDDPGMAGILILVEPVATASSATPAGERAAWFEALVAGSSDYSVVLDGGGRLLYLSGPRLGADDAAAAGFVGRTIFDIVPPTEVARTRAWFELVAQNAGQQHVGYLTIDVGGDARVLEVRATNLLDDPAVGGILAVCRDVTDQRSAEHIARVAGHLVERSPLIVVAADATGEINAWNPAAERVLGWKAEEVLGRHFGELGGFTQASLSLMYERMPQLVAGGTIEAETDFLTRDGSSFAAFIVASGLLAPDGKFEGFLVLALDLREQHELRSAAARSDARWSSIFRHTRELAATVDENGVANYIGPGFERLLGYDPIALVGTSLREIVHPDDRERPGGLADLMRDGGESYVREYRIRHADGSWRVFDIQVVDHRDDPAIGAFLLNGLDVTDRVFADDANKRLAGAIDSAGAIVVVTDLRQRILSWNKRAEDLFGIKADELGDLDRLASITPTHEVPQRQNLLRQVGKGATTVFDTSRTAADGRTLDFTSVVSPVYDAAGNVCGASWIAFDITEQKAALREREQRAAQQAVVAELGHRALAGAGVDDLLSEACELVARTLGVDEVLVLLLGDSGASLELDAATSGFADLIGTAHWPLAEAWWCVQALAAGRPVAYEDLGEAPGELPHFIKDRTVASGALSAMDGRQGLIGVVAVLHSATRPFPSAEVDFLQAVGSALGTAVERRRIDDEMRRRALHDDLTDLPNRTLFVDRLTQALTRTSRRGDRLALLFVDLDRFKRVNDTLGHLAGDLVLTATAQRLLRAVRQGDTVARVGGDEFLVLCEDVRDGEEAEALAGRIGASLAAPIEVGDHDVVVSASVGIALATDESDAESLVSDADLAMYRAKERGRARAEVFDEEMREEVVSRLAIEQALRVALASASIHVVYQPVVDLTSGRVVGVEALSRWDQEPFGAVAPALFLAVAEEIGLVDDLGGVILQAACATVAELRRRHDPRLTIAVNASARQLAGTRLRGQIDDALELHALAPEALIIELTETDVLDDQLAMPALHALREQGVGLSIDDFGTGYSSLQRVARLPVDEVKIDQSFVAGVGVDRGADAVIRATITLADSLGMRLVAEGIERPEQRKHLLALGCRYGQGLLFSGPLVADELDAWLTDVAPTLRSRATD